MADGDEQSLFERLVPTISAERLGTYLRAAGFDKDRALRLYHWNARIGESFHFAIQGVEVGLRNSVNVALCAEFGPDWWKDPKFRSQADRERLADLDQAERRIKNRGTTLCTPQMVATLSFGFWVGMLQPRYNPDVWSKHLETAFPNLPDDTTRGDLAAAAKRVADLRNRIWHHEPIFKMSLNDEFRELNILLKWVCPTKADWIRAHSVVLALLRQKP